MGKAMRAEMQREFNRATGRLTAHQDERLRTYCEATAAKHKQFVSNVLETADDAEAVKLLPSVQHTFAIERGNAALKVIHDRMINSTPTSF